MDFSIIGSPWKNRIELRDLLKQNGIHVSFISNVFRDDYVDSLAHSLVTINANQNVGRGLLVMRIFEALGARTCLITEQDDGIEKVLKPGVECFVYKNINELIDICNTIKDDKKLANWVAENGFIRGIKEHTYECRAKQILETLGVSS